MIGAFTPCAFAINVLLLGYLRDKPRVERMPVVLRFAGIRALFLTLVGLLFALALDRIGPATVRYQQAIDVLLIVLGSVFIVGHYRPLPFPNLNLGTWLQRSQGAGVGFGVLFGLDIPACASLLFFAVSPVLANSFAGRLLPKVRRGRKQQLRLKIANTHCQGCLAGIRQAATKLRGVEEVTGDPAQQMITVTYREGVAEPDGVREAIIDRGFLIG